MSEQRSVRQSALSPIYNTLKRGPYTLTRAAHTNERAKICATKRAACFMCCSVLQCVAVCCSVLQCVAVRDTVQCLFHFRFLESRNFSIHYSHTCQPVYFRGFGVRSEMDTLMGQQFTEVRVHMCRHSRPF